MSLERTDVANYDFKRRTASPLAVIGGEPVETLEEAKAVLNGAAMDPFEDNTPLACGIENPEGCEVCE